MGLLKESTYQLYLKVLDTLQKYVLRPSSGVCRTREPSRCENNNKDEDNSPKTRNDKNH